MDQTSTSFYQHDTQTYTPNTTSGELKATGRLNHNLQEKNTGQEYSEDLPTEDDTPQMATRAKAMTMSTQPTPQEIQEHNITHILRTSKRQASKSPEADIAASNRAS